MRNTPLLLMVLSLTVPVALAFPSPGGVANQLADVAAPVADVDPTLGRPVTLKVQFLNKAPTDVTSAQAVLVTVANGVAGDYMTSPSTLVPAGQTVDLRVTWTPATTGPHVVRGYVLFDDLRLDLPEVTLPVTAPPAGDDGDATGDGSGDTDTGSTSGGEGGGGATADIRRAVPMPLAVVPILLVAVLRRR